MTGISRLVARFIGFLLVFFVIPPIMYAQTHMRIHNKGGEYIDVPTEKIDSIIFVNGDSVQIDKVELNGSWFWGSTEAGYYELLTFIEDKTHTK